MARKGHRTRIGRGIYRDGSGLAAVVCVAPHPPKEKRFPPDTAITYIRNWQERLRAKLRARRGHTPARGTLAADAPRYLRQKRHLASFVSLRAEVRAWTTLLGPRPRTRITQADVLAAVATWLQPICAGCRRLHPLESKAARCVACGGRLEPRVSPKTVNNRLYTLKDLYRTLDGRDALTPGDEVRRLAVHKTPAVKVSVERINTVLQNLEAQERDGRLRDAKTRARYMVIVSTGRRPSEVARAELLDVDLERRVWIPRDGKGGFSPGIYLTDDMLIAWRLFIEANAWGPFETSSFARVLRHAGWPLGVRPYNARHSVGLELSERGVDLADVGAQLGHKRLETTRSHYVPVLNSRMQRMGELLEGRLGWATPENARQGGPATTVDAPAPQNGSERRRADNAF